MKKYFAIFSVLIAGLASWHCSSKQKIKSQSLIPAFVKDSSYSDPTNKSSEEKIALGRYLFYDRRLSINNTKACATCHAQEFSFTDSYTRSIGALGDLHQRNAKPLINIIFQRYLTSSDSSLHFPEQQMNNPMLNDHPIELGIKGNEKTILDRLQKDRYYREQFLIAFPETDQPISLKNVQLAIASFVKTIISFNSPYDRFAFKKDIDALNGSSINGLRLFFSARLKCRTCHGGINFNTPSVMTEKGNRLYYFNTGEYNIDSKGMYPAYDQGLIELTHQQNDMGKYRVSTLRNLAFTAPYLHDGSAATLEDVISIYEDGGRVIDTGIYKGNGITNPYKHSLISGFKLNSQERKDLVSFLVSLSDSTLLKNPAYSNPFTSDETIKRP